MNSLSLSGKSWILKQFNQEDLNFIKDNNVRVWTGISTLENNNFYWINIWESEEYREQFLAKWIKSNNSGIFARALSLSAVCKNPSTYLYN